MQKESLSLDDFNMLTLLGVGNYSKVVLVRKKSNNKLYAMKIIKKIKSVNKIKKQQAYIERQILLLCSHPFIIKIHGSFQFSQKLYFILEYCPGGQLFGLIKRAKRLNQQMYLQSKKGVNFTQLKFYQVYNFFIRIRFCTESILFFQYSLKPQNVLIDEFGFIKLIDFGLSSYTSSNKQNNHTPIAGTPDYLSPQGFIGNNTFGYSSDWWSFGCLIFEMMVGFPPFFSKQQTVIELKNRITKDEPPLHLVPSQVAQDLIKKLLIKNPQKRLGFKGSSEIKNHQWFSGVNWDKIFQRFIKPPFKPQLSSDCDVSFFDLQQQNGFTPPQQKIVNIDRYQSFSLSWKSNSPPSLNRDASPPQQLTINIKQN